MLTGPDASIGLKLLPKNLDAVQRACVLSLSDNALMVSSIVCPFKRTPTCVAAVQLAAGFLWVLQ